MKIAKAIFSVDDNEFYAGLWPLVSEICYKKLGILPVLFRITSEDSDFYEDDYGIIKNVKSIDGISTGRQSQIIRMWATKYFQNEVCIISDIDMLMFNKNYFIDQVEDYSDDDLVIYCSDAYDSSRSECTGIYSDRYTLAYNAATGNTFNRILNTDCEFEDYIKRVLSYEFPDFDSDEMYYTYMVENSDHGVNVIKLKRGYYTKFKCPRRIDRESDDIFNRYNPELIKSGYYVDCHLARPYIKHKESIDKLKDIILGETNREIYLIGCHTETFKQKSLLLELVDSLVNKEKDFVITSHTSVPESVIEKSIGFIYDSINPKYKTWNLNGVYKFAYETDSFILRSPYVTYGSSDYYHVGVIRLLINGIRYLQTLDYDIAHWIEYDSLPIISMDDRAKNLLIDYDFIFHGIGSRFSFNIKKANQKFLDLTDDDILTELSKREYLAERVIDDLLIDGKKYTEYVDESDNTLFGRYSQNFNNQIMNWSLFEHSGSLNLFARNLTDKEINIEVFHNGEKKEIQIGAHSWMWRPISEIGINTFIKIKAINGSNEIIILESDLSLNENYLNIVKSVEYISK